MFPSKNKKINKKCSGPDENYGLADELVDDLTPAEFKIRKDNFLNELKTINRGKKILIRYRIKLMLYESFVLIFQKNWKTKPKINPNPNFGIRREKKELLPQI